MTTAAAVRGTYTSQALEPGLIDRLLVGRGEAGLGDRIRQCLEEMVAQFAQTGGCTQIRALAQTHLFVKVRRTGPSAVETLLYDPLGSPGANKKIWRVVSCSEGTARSYAYAKDSWLIEDQKRLRGLRREKNACDSIEGDERTRTLRKERLEREIQETVEDIRWHQEHLRHEYEMASLVPCAVRTSLVFKIHSPREIKGLEMEYVPQGDLYESLKRCPRLPCSPFSMELASEVCAAVASANEAGVVHGDINPKNILLRDTPEGLTPVLCDFGAASRLSSAELYTKLISTYAPPEMYFASSEQPGEFTVSMDSWSLGLTVAGIVYGMDLIKKVEGRVRKQISCGWDSIQAFLQEEPAVCPGVDEVVRNLLQPKPEDRWTARQASERLLCRSAQLVAVNPRFSYNVLSACLESCMDPLCSMERLLLASRICSAADRMHRFGFFHGEITTSTIMLREDSPLGFDPILCNRGSVRHLPPKVLCTKWESDLCPPEVRCASSHPVPYAFPMDSWSLGQVVLETVYGPNVGQAAARAWREPWDWSLVQSCLRQQSGLCCDVEEVIQNLMRVNPEERWTAQQAAEELGLLAEEAAEEAPPRPK